MIIDKEKLLNRCVAFVQQAVVQGLQIDHDFSTKLIAGGSTHVGSTDIANTMLAEHMFSEFGLPIIIEERKPTLSEWPVGQGVILVDPLDGSAEIGTGGSQFAAGVSVYDETGSPVCGAAGSPGIRPIFRVPSPFAIGGFKFNGFGNALGAIVFGGPGQLSVMPLRNRNIGDAMLVPALPAQRLRDNPYSSVTLDPGQSRLA